MRKSGTRGVLLLLLLLLLLPAPMLGAVAPAGRGLEAMLLGRRVGPLR